MWHNDFMRVGLSKEALLEKFRYLQREGLHEYSNRACEVFGFQKLPNKTDNSIIEQIFFKSYNEFLKKRGEKLYYVTNVVCFLEMLRRLFREQFIISFDRQDIEEYGDLVIYNYAHLLRELLFDGVYILTQYEIEVEKKEKSRFPGLGLNTEQHDAMLYHYLSQILFGQVSFHSNKDREPHTSSAVIRQMIELRLKRAFGIFGWVHSKNHGFKAISMSEIFELLNDYKDKIDFSVPLIKIKRIYQWSSICFHIGFKDYLWKSIFVLDYLRTFMIGKITASGDFNIRNGVKLSTETFQEIRKRLLNTKPNYNLISNRTPQVVFEDG